MKYRILTLVGLLALSAGAILQAQDYDDIYYDGSKSTASKKTKVETPAKTVVIYGDVPETCKVTARSNYRVERDEDEYNRRGAYDQQYEYVLDLNGDTIYDDSIYSDEAFANTHLIERFYNPDIVALSSDDELVELYYDESPTVNLIVGSDWGSWYGWNSYYPWYTSWHYPWYGWYHPRYYGMFSYDWYWGPYDWMYGHPYSLWGWGGHHYRPWAWGGHPHGWDGWVSGNVGRPHPTRPNSGVGTGRTIGHRTGLATNRNDRPRVDASGSGRSGISARTDGNGRPNVGGSVGRTRPGTATTRSSGNMGSRPSGGVSPRRSGSSGSSYSGGSRSGSGSSYSGGSRSGSGSSYSGGSRSGSGGSHGGSSGGGGSRGGSSGGGGHRR